MREAMPGSTASGRSPAASIMIRTSLHAIVAESRRGVGMDETATIGTGDDLAGDDSVDYWIETRHFSGRSCGTWELTVGGHYC